jgi:hypothetical protein
MEHQYIKFIIRVLSIVLWILFILWIGTHTKPDVEHFEEEKVEKSEGTIAGTASAISNLLGTKPKVDEKPKQISSISPEEELYMRCIRLDERVINISNTLAEYAKKSNMEEKTKEMLKWYNASQPQTQSSSGPTKVVEGFADRKVTYADVANMISMVQERLSTMEKEFNELSNKIEPVYKWYIFKKEQTGAPLKEAFEEEKKDVNAVVIKPSKKITYSPEILREQINNLEKQVNNFQMQVNLFISDFKTLSTWYDNVTRLEREQNAKAIAQAKASFEEKVMAATQSEAVASRPPGMTPPSGIPTKTTEQSKNELTGVLTSSISSSSKTQEQQAQVAKAMLDTKNL